MRHDKALWIATVSSITLSMGTYIFFKKKYSKYMNGIKLVNSKNTNLIKSFVPFQEWCHNVSENLLSGGNVLENVRIIEEYKFGKKIGILLMEAKIKYENTFLSGLVVLRCPSCAILMWYQKNGEIYVLMIRQPRVAMGKFVWEVPAGMLDGETKNVKGKMLDEIKEETGIYPEKEKLDYLDTCYSSCGITDEKYMLFSLEIDPYCVLNIHPENLGTKDEVTKNIKVFNINEAPREDVKFLALKCLFLDKKFDV